MLQEKLEAYTIDDIYALPEGQRAELIEEESSERMFRIILLSNQKRISL